MLVDTSIWIESWRRNGDPAAIAAVTEVFAADATAVCHPVLLELVRGAQTDAERRRIEAHFATMPVLEVDNAAWMLAAGYAYALRRKGLTVGPMDVLIATVAVVHGASLLHRDRHFTMCAEVMPLEDISPPF